VCCWNNYKGILLRRDRQWRRKNERVVNIVGSSEMNEWEIGVWKKKKPNVCDWIVAILLMCVSVFYNNNNQCIQLFSVWQLWKWTLFCPPQQYLLLLIIYAFRLIYKHKLCFNLSVCLSSVQLKCRYIEKYFDEMVKDFFLD